MVQPLVSIIIPTFDSAEYILESINSVIEQTYQNWELIIIDDGSTDNTLSLLYLNYGKHKAIKILYHENHENLGVSKSRKLGIKEASGEYIAFLDSDDFYFPNKIETQIQIFKKHPEVVLIHSRVVFKNENNNNETYKNEFILKNESFKYEFTRFNFLEHNPICNSSVIVKKETIENIENYFPQVYQYEDWITWILIANKGLFYYMNEATCTYRFHNKASTNSLIKNSLKAKYAKIEFLLILFSRVKSKKIKDKIHYNLNKEIKELYSIYTQHHKNSDKLILNLFESKIIILIKKKIDYLTRFLTKKLFNKKN